MPNLGRGTECVQLLLSQVSKDMHQPIVPMIFPILGAHVSGAEFMYPDQSWKETCGMLANLVADSGAGKGQLSGLVEALCRDFRQHEEEPTKLGARTRYLNMPEVEMADRMCGGHKQVSQMVRNIFDCQRAGALRATADGVTGNPLLRVNLTFTSTPEAARLFYKKDLTNGFFGRIPFAYKARGERSGKIPRQGTYNKDFLEKLDGYLLRLDNCKGSFVVKQLNKIADKLAEEMARLADLADDDTLWELSHRSIFSAWKKGAVLWILNDQSWSKSIGDFVEWFCYYDLWSKVKVFGDMFKAGDGQEEAQRSGPKNMLDQLENSFNELQLETLRLSLGKNQEGTKHQLNVWKNRQFITYNSQTKLYTKTAEYLTGIPAKKKKGKGI